MEPPGLEPGGSFPDERSGKVGGREASHLGASSGGGAGLVRWWRCELRATSAEHRGDHEDRHKCLEPVLPAHDVAPVPFHRTSPTVVRPGANLPHLALRGGRHAGHVDPGHIVFFLAAFNSHLGVDHQPFAAQALALQTQLRNGRVHWRLRIE